MNMRRYEKYRPSGVDWIGDVPEHWEVMKLLYCLRQPICDGPHETPTLVEDGVPFISIDSLNDTKQIDLSKATKFISEDDYLTYMKKAKLEKGDVLFTKAATIGKTAIVGDEHFMVWSPLAILKNNRLKLSNLYLYYLLNCQRLVTSIVLSGSYNTQINVGMREMEKAYITVPSLAEQEAIAAYLDARCADIDKVVATQEKRIALLNEMKQSVITQAVTRGLNPDAKMKDSGVEWIGLVPEHWEVKKLKFVSNSISKGAGITKEQVVEDGDTQCVRYGEIYTKYNHSFDSCVSATNKDLHPVLQYFGYGDILFTCTGELVEEIGKSVVYLGHERCLAGGDILVVSHNQDPSFLNYALNSYAQIQKSEGRAKLKVVHISTYDISNLLLALPPIEEQKQIADEIDRRCSSIDKQIGAVTRQIELLREYKQSLITDVVTGKVKVC